MAAKPDIVAGTITLTTGSATFSGTDTFWQFADIQEGDTIIDVTGATEFMGVIEAITDNTSGTLTKPWEGPTLTAEYRIRYMADGQRQTAQARNLIELLGNGRLTAIASASETVGVIEMLPGGAARLVPLTDLVSGANYDVQVADMAARAAYDGQTAGFAVLVANTGDGRAAIFSKLSNASGDWSAAAYVTGPVGPPADVTVGTTTTGAPGTPALVTPTPTPGGVELSFAIPAGEGFAFQGAYDVGTAYNKGDVVGYNSSSWIALQATTGNAPPVLPTTANAHWGLLAAAGVNGTGTGDMIGPAGATDGAFVGFDGPTGKQTKQLSAAAATALLNPFGSSLKGLVPAPSAGDVSGARLLTAAGNWIDPPVSDTSDLETTVSMLALQVADNTNIVLFLGPTGNRVADSFDTLTYVDVAGATNLDTATAGVLKPTTAPGTDQTATHTSATASGNTASASTTTSGFDAWKAFDKVVGQTVGVGTWVAATNMGWLQYQFATAKTIAAYTVRSGNGYAARAPLNFSLQGSNSGAFAGEQVTLDAQTGVSGWAAGGQVRNYSIAAPASYVYYRLNIAAVNGDALLLIDEVTLISPPTANNLTVRSASFTAASAPSKMKGLIRVKEVVAAVAGTDYSLECSRDNGTTWSAMSLSEMFTTGGLLYVETAEVDVSGQPAGTAPRWRFKTLNNKNVELHDVYLYWS